MKRIKQFSQKTTCIFRLMFLCAMLSGPLDVFGQISVAPNPVTAGTFGSSFSYSNTQNSQNYRNYYGRSTYEVSYKFTLTAAMSVVISNCGSTLSDT
ncbi:MAG: hypothetical protein LBR97_09215 [Dysgonamonadaceae bacterium]|jgi:hypothetical protein|nr:hypothetical protein [Dysgonamonadaceae bacterium]